MSHQARSGADRPTTWARVHPGPRLGKGATACGWLLRIRRVRGAAIRRPPLARSGGLLRYRFQPNSTSVNTSVSPMPVFAMFEFRPSVHTG